MSGNKVINNAKWIIVCRIGQALLQLVIGMLCARYLGPANYGVINYAASITAFLLPVMQLGLQSTLVQEFIESPEREGKIMGTALVMDLVSSFVCVGMITAFVSVVNRGESDTIIVCFLYSLSLVFRAFELVQYWFQYKLKSKYPSVVMLVAYAVVSVYRVYLLATGKSIFFFAIVNALDYSLIGGAILVIYRRVSPSRLSFSFPLVSKLFSRSKYYILAAMMVTVFQNTDHIMLKLISGDAENGYYTAAITCAAVFQFVYAAIVDSFRPVILQCKKDHSVEYEKKLSLLYCITTYMALLEGVGFSVLADFIVYVLYGAEYLAAVPVLRVLVWYISFSYMGSVRNIWILAEAKQSLLWRINLAGALANIAMNALLIPLLGALGAATASLLTQIFTNLILGFIVPSLRENNRILIKGLDPRLIVQMIPKRKN